MPDYQWKVGAPKPKVSAQVFGEELERLAGGQSFELVPPQEIVDAARPRRSLLHALFKWNDEEEAELWRRHLARTYVGSLQIVRVDVKNGREISTRAFYSVTVEKQRGYASDDRIRGDHDLTRQVLEQARDELKSYLARFGGRCDSFGNYVARLQGVIDDMQAEIDLLTAEALTRRRTRYGQRPGQQPGTSPTT